MNVKHVATCNTIIKIRNTIHLQRKKVNHSMNTQHSIFLKPNINYVILNLRYPLIYCMVAASNNEISSNEETIHYPAINVLSGRLENHETYSSTYCPYKSICNTNGYNVHELLVRVSFLSSGKYKY